MTDLTPEQQAACDAYWAAKTHEDEHWAYVRMLRAGLPPSMGESPEEVERIINCPDCPPPTPPLVITVDGVQVQFTPAGVHRLITENKLLRANPWHRDEGGVVKSFVAIPGTELIAMSDTDIVGIVVWRDRLICATKKGVFERCLDGKFREIKFAPAPDVIGCITSHQNGSIAMIAGTQFKPLSQDELRDDYFVALYGAHDSMTDAYNLRAEQGWNQKAISLRLDCDESLVSRRLNGEENMTLRTMSGMASALDCRLTIIFTPYEQCGAGNNYFISDADEHHIQVPNKQIDPAYGPDETAAVVTQEAEPDERWQTIGKLLGKNPPPPPLKPSERLLYPGPVASAIYTDIVRWQTKNYGIAPPCWMIPIADYIALCKEFGAKDGEEISGDINIAGIKIVVDPAALSVKYDTPILRAAYPVQSHDHETMICEACGEKFKPQWTQAEAIAELEARFLGWPVEACRVVCHDCYDKWKDPPLSQRGFGTDKDE